jgi:GDPmannose 4,6-dehydratase
MNICQAVLNLKLIDKVRIFHASTSEMFGDYFETKGEVLVSEGFPFSPVSPYAASKISAYYLVQFYRNVHRMFICTGLTFNHESPLRHETFITRKITKAVMRIKFGLQDTLNVGNIYSKRDWGYAGDYVKGFWAMLNKQESPHDFIIATSDSISVKQFAERAFQQAGWENIEWQGEGLHEKLVDLSTQKVLLQIDPQFYRPGEVNYLRGCYDKIKEALGWTPSFTWQDLQNEMLDYDSALAERELETLTKFSRQKI